jgi:hypothetical protein
MEVRAALKRHFPPRGGGSHCGVLVGSAGLFAEGRRWLEAVLAADLGNRSVLRAQRVAGIAQLFAPRAGMEGSARRDRC